MKIEDFNQLAQAMGADVTLHTAKVASFRGPTLTVTVEAGPEAGYLETLDALAHARALAKAVPNE